LLEWKLVPRLSAVSGRILIVDDDRHQRAALAAMLADSDFETQVASDGLEALERLASFNADVIIADLVMPRMDGFELIRHLKERGDLTPAIALTGFGSMEKALSVIHDLKAFWFLEKPVEPRAFKTLLDRAILYKRSLQKTEELKRDLTLRGVLGDMVGTSPAMQRIFAIIRQVAPTSAPVLIRGESGTGKELVAREIHKYSRRGDGPFVAINAAALPETLIESELFGHEKGAFTGATSARRGKFELADGGTLFLDEVGDLHGSSQAKLLRVLQEGEFHRVGGEQSIKVSVRVIAATNRDLSEMVAQQKFREDLYYRLRVVPIRVPALRERREDIRPLAEYFLSEFCARNNFKPKCFAPPVFEALEDYHWQGNIRELRNTVERMAILTRGDVLESESVPVEIRIARSSSPKGNLREAKESAEREHILKALEESKWNVSSAARVLGMERTNLHKRIRALGLARGQGQ
jgi:two-component system nitrogen regulation response regulator NtrX